MATYQDFPPAAIVLAPRLTVAGEASSSLEGVNTGGLADGCQCYIRETNTLYRLDLESSQAASASVVVPAAGLGRWAPEGTSPQSINQAVWFIDNTLTTSSDNNDGLTIDTALLTLEGFTDRTNGGKFEQPTEVFVSGDHTDEQLQAYYQFSKTATLAVRGTSAVVLTTQAITGFTANSPGTGEARTLSVTGFDWTPFIGKRIRFLDGPAAGNVCWIGTDDPAGVGLDTVRITPVGDTLTDFSTTITFVDPAVTNSFVIEDLTRIGGVDLSVLQGATDVGVLPARVIQFSDFDTTPGSGSSSLIPGTSNGLIFTRSLLGSGLVGPGLIDPTLCHWTGILTAFSGLSVVFRSCLMTSSFGMVLVGSLSDCNFLDCIFQGATLTIRTRLVIAQNCGYFDRTADAIQVDAAALLFSRNTSFGSGITGVGMNLNGGAVVTFDTLPTIVGAGGEVTIGGSPELYAALPTAPINGAGIYPN